MRTSSFKTEFVEEGSLRQSDLTRAGLEPNIMTALGLVVQESERYIAFLVKRYNMIGLLPSDIRTPSSYNLQILPDSEMIHDEQRLEL